MTGLQSSKQFSVSWNIFYDLIGFLREIPVTDFFKSPEKNKDKNQKRVADEISLFIIEIAKAVLIIIASGALIPMKEFKKKGSKLSSISKKNANTLCFVTLLSGLALLLILLTCPLSIIQRLIFALPTAWLIGFGASFSILRAIKQRPDKDFITTEDLKNSIKDFGKITDEFAELEEIMEDPSQIPLGISLKDGSPVTIPITQMLEHSLSSGATGQGKTTLLKTKIHHYIKHKRPVIIIDPKGERKDVNEVRALCEAYGRADSFKLFSISERDISNFYNPLKVGDPQQKKSKLMNGLNLTHEYFGALADEFLTTVLDAHQLLNRDIDLKQLHKYIINPNFFAGLVKDIRNLPSSDIVDDFIEKLLAAQKIDFKELKGLSAQLASLNALSIWDILNPNSSKSEIDILGTLQSGGVAYFQMNINGYSSISKAIGKLIVQDLRLVSNMIQSEQVNRRFDYAFVSIDEFGSFVYLDFADYIKQTRSASIGLDLSFQGIADTRQVSPDFAEQILGNTVNKFILRQDLKDDVETWSAMAGTKDTVIESHQTSNSLLGGSEETGLGNVHEGKAVLIDFDVFKKLTTGHAVLIDKKRHINCAFAIWNGESRLPKKKTDLAQATIKNGVMLRKITLKAIENE
jgi:hypothetical protein